MSTEDTFQEQEQQQQMDSDSDEYDNEINYENLKQEGGGGSNNGAVQQSMKHFQPTNKILSKYIFQSF
jgi:hypothetical protein